MNSRKPSEVSVALWYKRGVEQTDSNNNATRHSRWLEQRNKTPSWISIMADNKKQEKDYTKEVDSLLPEVELIAKVCRLTQLHKFNFSCSKSRVNCKTLWINSSQLRSTQETYATKLVEYPFSYLFLQAADLTSTTRLVKAAVQHCYDARNYTLLNSTISLLSKKHGQLKAAVQAIVEQVLSWLEKVRERDGNEKWLELVETLRGVTEGKVCPSYIIPFFLFTQGQPSRSFWKRRERALHFFSHITMRDFPNQLPPRIPKSHYRLPQISFQIYKLKPILLWNEERRQSLFWNKCAF
jgi:hypothetical protein